MFGDVAVFALRGELDLALCVKLAPELNAALRSSARAIVIDLEAVSLVDSSGIALLLNTFRALHRAGRRDSAELAPATARSRGRGGRRGGRAARL